MYVLALMPSVIANAVIDHVMEGQAEDLRYGLPLANYSRHS